MIDTSVLHKIFESEEMIQKFLISFRLEIQKSLQQLEECVTSKDYEQAGIVAHSIKSLLKYLNESVSAEIASDIEFICENPGNINHDLIKKMIKNLQTEMENVLIKVNKKII